jgi:hypothetical protein
MIPFVRTMSESTFLRSSTLAAWFSIAFSSSAVDWPVAPPSFLGARITAVSSTV